MLFIKVARLLAYAGLTLSVVHLAYLFYSGVAQAPVFPEGIDGPIDRAANAALAATLFNTLGVLIASVALGLLAQIAQSVSREYPRG